MTGLTSLVKRNTKLYFKDKGMFFSSLITPIILLVLYSTFLKKVYDDSFRSALISAGASASDAVIKRLRRRAVDFITAGSKLRNRVVLLQPFNDQG